MTKSRWRARLLAARRARPAPEVARARERTGAHLVGALTALRPGAVVCIFLPLPTEPLPTDLAEPLLAAGLRVLAPIARRDLPLSWCELTTATIGPAHVTRGMAGVAEPIGPVLEPGTIREADAVLVPALAVDSAGTRLGRGGGHYDRSLALLGTAGPTPRAQQIETLASPLLIAVVFDDEFLDHRTDPLPSEVHDMPVTDVVTPGGGRRHVAIGGSNRALSD